MLFIFNDEGRGQGAFLPDSFRNGAIFSRECVAGGLCGVTTPHRPLLITAKNRSRHGGAIIVNRP